jgi:phosphatidylglycerol---prolipoprotein diacylglyceryl transferase
MMRTLFFIPHEILGLPVFGWGWALIVLLLVTAIGWIRNGSTAAGRAELIQQLPLLGVMAAALVWILPAVELRSIKDEPMGIAVRGYGVMMMLSILSAIGLAVYRAKRKGYPLDDLYFLTVWLVIGGISGARAFYVIQYFDQFQGDSILETAKKIVNFTTGGLVVYGSLIGGLLAGLLVAYFKRLPVGITGDLIIPSVFLGVALGRIGCLLNGCCYGAACEPSWFAAQFPPGSPPYEAQLADGSLLGLKLAATDGQQSTDGQQALGQQRVIAVEPNSPAAKQRIEPGDLITTDSTQGDPSVVLARAPIDPNSSRDDFSNAWARVRVNGRLIDLSPSDLPRCAKPLVHAQLIGAGTAMILVLGLLWLSRYSLRDGTLLGLGFVGYAVIRFGLEMVRNDESGQWGTNLTISQWVSLAILAVAPFYFWLNQRGWFDRNGQTSHDEAAAKGGLPQQG